MHIQVFKNIVMDTNKCEPTKAPIMASNQWWAQACEDGQNEQRLASSINDCQR